MLIKISPSEDQIRWYVQNALGQFETLDIETAAAGAQANLRDLLKYLDAVNRTDDTVAVFLPEGTESRIGLEGFFSNANLPD